MIDTTKILKNASFNVVELNESTGYIDLEVTFVIPENDGGGQLHFIGRINITKLKAE